MNIIDKFVMECKKNGQIINYMENRTKLYIYHYYLKKIISNLSYFNDSDKNKNFTRIFLNTYITILFVWQTYQIIDRQFFYKCFI